MEDLCRACAPLRASAEACGVGDNGAMSEITIVRDADALEQWGPAWDALEVRARAAGREDQLFASHRYVSTAWEHLQQPGDRLFVVLLGEGERLDAVWPLALREERHSGLTLQVLRPIGIWEGERPAPLCEVDADSVWPGLWQALQAHRSEWHVLDLRELDEGSWPLRHLPKAGWWWRVTAQPDHTAPWQPFSGPWAEHAARHGPRPSVPGAAKLVLDDPSGIVEGLSRCLAVEATQAGVEGLYRLSDDEQRVAFYRAFLPKLAARGEAEVWLLQVGGEDVAGLVRWRCGGVWIERHLTEAAGWGGGMSPGGALLVDALARSWGSGAQASAFLLVPDAVGPGQRVRSWFDQARPTQRLSVWNLRSRVLPLALLQKVRGK